MVDLGVGPVSPVVLPQVLDGGHGQNEDHGRERQLGLERVDHRDEVQQGDEDEVDVGEAVELLEEVLGQEGQQRVLGGLDPVVGVVAVGVLPAFGALAQRVGVHGPGLGLLGFLLLPRPLDFRSVVGPGGGVLGVPRHWSPPPPHPRKKKVLPRPSLSL